MAFFNSPTPGSAMAAQVQGAPPVQVAPTDVIGPIMKKWETEAQNQMLKAQAQRALMGSAFGLAGSGLGAWGLNGFPLKGTMVGNLFGVSNPAANKMGQGVGSHLNYSMGGQSDPGATPNLTGNLFETGDGGGSVGTEMGSDLSLLNGGGQVADLGAGLTSGAPASGMTGLAGAGDLAGLGMDMSMLGSGAAGVAGSAAADAAAMAALDAGATAGFADLLPLLALL